MPTCGLASCPDSLVAACGMPSCRATPSGSWSLALHGTKSSISMTSPVHRDAMGRDGTRWDTMGHPGLPLLDLWVKQPDVVLAPWLNLTCQAAHLSALRTPAGMPAWRSSTSRDSRGHTQHSRNRELIAPSCSAKVAMAFNLRAGNFSEQSAPWPFLALPATSARVQYTLWRFRATRWSKGSGGAAGNRSQTVNDCEPIVS